MVQRVSLVSNRTRTTRDAAGAGALGSIGAGVAVEPTAASPCETSAGGAAVHGSRGLFAFEDAGWLRQAAARTIREAKAVGRKRHLRHGVAVEASAGKT